MPLPLSMPRFEDDIPEFGEQPHPPGVRHPLADFAKAWSMALRKRIREERPDVADGTYCMVLRYEGGWQLDVCDQRGAPAPAALRQCALDTCPVEVAHDLPARLEVQVVVHGGW